MRKLALVVGLVFGLCGTAQAHSVLGHIRALHPPSRLSTDPIQAITIIGGHSHAVERALQYQLNQQVRPHWHQPLVHFAADGWKIYLTTMAQVASVCGDGAHGCHYQDASGTPVAFVARDSGYNDATIMLSHELIEMMLDPSADRRIGTSIYLPEAADPVESDFYDVNGIAVSDFIYPRWATAGSPGPWDWMNELHHAQENAGDVMEYTSDGSVIHVPWAAT